MTDYTGLKQRMKAVEPRKFDRALWTLSKEFEDTLLLSGDIPPQAFDFITEILSDKGLAGKKGLAHFLMVLYFEFEKLSTVQADRLLTVLIENSSFYADELTRLRVGDLIARKYPKEAAERAFGLLDGDSDYGSHIALFGRDVLSKRD